MTNQISDNVLIERIIAGDKSLFGTLIERHKDYAFTLALRVLNNREDAEEVAHDAFLKALRSLSSFKMESKFTTWFYKIVVNMAISRRRKKRIDTQEIEISNTQHYSTFDDLGGMPKEDRKFFINKAIDLLKDEEKVLITLFYFEEMDMEEISDITGIDKNNLKVKMFRARKKLAGVLSRMLKDEIHSLL